MTATQVNYIVTEILDDVTDEYTPMENLKYVVMFGDQRLYSNINYNRFKFDMQNELIEFIACRPYSKNINDVPEHGYYEISTVDGINYIYEYLVDSEGNMIIDYFNFENIVMIVM